MRNRLVLLAAMVLSLILIKNSSAQLGKGQMEFSSGAAIMGVQESGGDIESSFNLATRFGYFISNGFEIEPEIILSSYGGGGNPGVILSANFLYNLFLPKDSRAIPFFLVGGGWANSLHYFNQMNFGDMGRDYTILNMGIGLKSFLNNSVALRFEYRFQRFFAEKEVVREWWGESHIYDPSLNFHNFLMGISVFLK